MNIIIIRVHKCQNQYGTFNSSLYQDNMLNPKTKFYNSETNPE